MRRKLGKDFKIALTSEWLSNKAVSHLEGWEEYYRGKSISDIDFELQVNHDPSLEIEDMEIKLSRRLTDDEQDYLVEKFNKAVISERRKLLR
jgi:hypothetical protein